MAKRSKSRLSKQDKKQLEKLFAEQLESLYKSDRKKKPKKDVRKRKTKPSKKVRKLRLTTELPKTDSGKRFKNRKCIIFAESKKTEAEIIQALNSFDWATFNYLLKKQKFPDGSTREPLGVTLIFSFKKGKTVTYNSFMSPLEERITLNYLRSFAIGCVEKTAQDYSDSFKQIADLLNDGDEEDQENAEYINNFDISFLWKICIHFYYGK